MSLNPSEAPVTKIIPQSGSDAPSKSPSSPASKPQTSRSPTLKSPSRLPSSRSPSPLPNSASPSKSPRRSRPIKSPTHLPSTYPVVAQPSMSPSLNPGVPTVVRTRRPTPPTYSSSPTPLFIVFPSPTAQPLPTLSTTRRPHTISATSIVEFTTTLHSTDAVRQPTRSTLYQPLGILFDSTTLPKAADVSPSLLDDDTVDSPGSEQESQETAETPSSLE